MTALTVKRAALSTGVRLPYVDAGDPDGIPVLLLHGWTDSWRSFETVLGHVLADIRAIAVTQRGHGNADRPQDGYAPRDLAADAAALLDALEIDRAVVAGHSMSAWVAERLALEDSARVSGLVLVAAIGPTDANPVMTELVDAAATFTDPVDPGFVREFQLGTTERALAPGQIDLFVDESLKLPARVWRATAAGFPRGDLYDVVAAVAAPTLLVWGDRDAVASRDEQDRLLRAIPRARLSVYEGTGHALHWEEPARFADEVAAFAGEVTR